MNKTYRTLLKQAPSAVVLDETARYAVICSSSYGESVIFRTKTRREATRYARIALKAYRKNNIQASLKIVRIEAIVMTYKQIVLMV